KHPELARRQRTSVTRQSRRGRSEAVALSAVRAQQRTGGSGDTDHCEFHSWRLTFFAPFGSPSRSKEKRRCETAAPLIEASERCCRWNIRSTTSASHESPRR